MINNFKELIRTDLVQAKILKEHDNLSYPKFIYLFIRSRTCKVHTFVRLRSSNTFIAFVAKIWLDRFFIEIGTKTQIGKYFFLPHPRCVIIANKVILGDHIHVGQNVTIGGSFNRTKVSKQGVIQKAPILGNKIILAHGAVIGGPVTIGNEVIVGANSVVTKNVPGHKIVSGQNIISERNISVPNDCGKFIFTD